MTEDLEKKVKEIVAKELDVEEVKVTETSSFVDDLGADSLDQVELIMALEDAFGCEIPDDVAEKIVTVGDAIKFIQEHKK